MQNKLELSLSLTIDWLKFAEGKNATLIAANGAAIFGIITTLNSDFISNAIYEIYLKQAILFLFLSSLFCLVSFVPQVSVSRPNETITNAEGGNLLLYANIANYESRLYLEELYKRESADINLINHFEEDLAELVVTYSRIAMRKYSLFTLGVWAVISAIATPVIALVIYFLRKKVC